MVRQSVRLIMTTAMLALTIGCAAVPYRIVRVVEEEPVLADAGDAEPADATDQSAEQDPIVSLTAQIESLAEQDAAHTQQIAALQQQLAELQDRLLKLSTDIDRIEKLTIARYERYLEEDRKVLQQLDTALSMWIESMQQQEAAPRQEQPSPDSSPDQESGPTYRSAQAREPEPIAETPAANGQLIILR